MPDRRWHKVARDLWLHRARSAMVIVAIVVGLVGAGAVLDTWALLRRATREEYRATDPAAATLRLEAGDAVDATLLAAVRALPTVRDVQARRAVVATVQVAGIAHTAQLFAFPGPAEARIGRLVHEKGAWPAADGTLVVERSSMAFAGIAPGDSVVLRLGNGPAIRVPVSGIARDAGLAPGWMEHVVYGFVSPSTLATLGGDARMDQLQLVVRDGTLDRAGMRAVARQARDVATRLGHRVREVDVPEPGRHVHAAQMDSLLMTQGAFGMLALLLGGVLVVNLVTAMLAGQQREIGIMKAIGARPAQLAGMYLGLALALGLVACAIALPLAALLGRAYARFAATMLNVSVDGYAIPRLAIVAQLAAAALLPLLAAAVPVVRASRTAVAAALRDVGIAGGGATPAWLARVRGPRRSLLLSLRNAFRRRARMVRTLATFATGGAVFLAALDLRAAIRASVGALYDDQMRFDMALRLETAQPAARAEAIARAVPGVALAEGWSGARAALADVDELGFSFTVLGLPPASRLVAFPLRAGRWLRDDDERALVVNARLAAEQPSLAVGREVALVMRGTRARWRIVGVVESGPTPSAYAARSPLARALGDTHGDMRASTIVVRGERRDVGAQSDLVTRVRAALENAALPVASSQLMAASRRVLEDHLLMVAGFLLAMAQLTVVVGGLGLASTMSLAVMERTREIGVMRALGATPGAIMRIVQAEALVVGLLGWLVAIPLSIPMSLALGRMFGAIMFPVPPSPMPQWSAVATWLAVAVGVSVLACAWPARGATRVSAAAALAYE